MGATGVMRATVKLTCVAAGSVSVQRLAASAVNLPPAGVLPAQTLAASRSAGARGPQSAAACSHE
jgi:hypothetical protein